ncbi:MAG: type II toxin-antitoxin system RelE/ParE family toxin [Thermodesulfovibrionales bacterium]|nr:type II toxin-antitoxin system RelE/ParE family toxin [Thermodesulfovibrionales bacterium]
MEQKRFKVVFSPAAQHDVEKLEIGIALQLAKDVRNYLEISPFPFGKTRIKRLTGFEPPLYRLRSGDFRVYYRIYQKEVAILAITHKKDSEKFLKRKR